MGWKDFFSWRDGQRRVDVSCTRASICSAIRFPVAVIIHGVGTGVIGIFIALLIRSVQVIFYGSDKGNFLQIVLVTPPWRRFACVVAGGIFGAVSWYWLRGVQPSIVGVETSIKTGKKMPPVVTLINAMIQDVVVALGGSFGREAAPREIAAMWGGVLSDRLGCSAEERALLVACGTGAGLAAVYSVPISGALYTIEHVLKWQFSIKNVFAAVVTSVIATYVATVEVENKALYDMPNYSYAWPSSKMILWAVIIGPPVGILANLFRRFVNWVSQFRPRHRFAIDFEQAQENHKVLIQGRWAQVTQKSTAEVVVVFLNEQKVQSFTKEKWRKANPEGKRDKSILIVMPVVFIALAFASLRLPSLLGNGRALALIALEHQKSFGLFSTLLLLKVVFTVGSIGAGAAGGTLTPSVAIGATLGVLAGNFLRLQLPALAPAEDLDAPMSVISAASFLSVAMMSPWTGLWLLVEFSGQGVAKEDIFDACRGNFDGLIRSKLAVGMLVPMAFSVAGGTIAVKVTRMLWECIFPEPAPSKCKPKTPRTPRYDLDLRSSKRTFYLDDEAASPRRVLSQIPQVRSLDNLLREPSLRVFAEECLLDSSPKENGLSFSLPKLHLPLKS